MQPSITLGATGSQETGDEVFTVDLDIPFRHNALTIGVPPRGGFSPEAAKQETVVRGNNDADTTRAVAATKRLMVYNARYELSTANAGDAIDRFVKQVEQMGGYLHSRENHRVVCRIPSKAFHALVEQVPSFGAVVHESINSLDVTKQYRDLRLRLETAQTAHRRMIALLEMADKIEDILKIEAELRKLTEEVERLKGELHHLSGQIFYSTVEISFRAIDVSAGHDRRDARSRFDWINRIGAEYVIEQF